MKRLSDNHLPSVQSNAHTQGLLLAVATYVMWGFFPLYFILLEPAGALEVIVHRTVWALVTCLIVLTLVGRLQSFRVIFHDRWALAHLGLAGLLIVTNWTIYVYAVMTERTTDAALGYFINPLFTVLLALIVLKERLILAEKIALALGGVAVLVLVIGVGSIPWISLALPVSFGLYSLVKKRVAQAIQPLAGMAVETLAVSPILIGYYIYLLVTKQTSFHILAHAQAPQSVSLHAVLLIGAGVLTMIPLTMLAASARHLPLGLLGMLQYMSPILQLIVGVWIFGEYMEPARWIASVIVWLALVVLSFGMWGQAKAQRRFEKHLKRAKRRHYDRRSDVRCDEKTESTPCDG
ncbi:MAG: EamA family transporter RarD [Actinomycetaceae bacterium]|nr:EamA family transporter RarD [Actinomycetaceae bacterium]